MPVLRVSLTERKKFSKISSLNVSHLMMKNLKSTWMVALLGLMSVLGTTGTAGAAAIAGAEIRVDGANFAGYAVTWKKEMRKDLVGQLVVKPLTFERDVKLPIDPKKPNTMMLKGKVEILSFITGDREVMTVTRILKLVKRKGAWYVDRNSLRRAFGLPEKPELD